MPIFETVSRPSGCSTRPEVSLRTVRGSRRDGNVLVRSCFRDWRAARTTIDNVDGRARRSARSPPMRQFHAFRLDTTNHCLWRGDERVSLTPGAFDLLRSGRHAQVLPALVLAAARAGRTGSRVAAIGPPHERTT